MNYYDIEIFEYLKNNLNNNFSFLENDHLKDNPKLSIYQDIENIISKGDFATDEIVNDLIKKVIFDPKNKNNLIFDGYPRSLSQAKNLDLLLEDSNQKISHIFFLNVKKEIIIKRIAKRKNIEKRSDDNLETILKRHETYMETTKPVLDFYSKNINFHEIDGASEI